MSIPQFRAPASPRSIGHVFVLPEKGKLGAGKTSLRLLFIYVRCNFYSAQGETRMKINATIASGSPAGFVAAVDDAIAFYEQTFDNNVTINITFSEAVLGGNPNAIAENNSPADTQQYSYSSVIKALGSANGGNSVLPTSDPFSATDGGDLTVTNADAAALGLTTTLSSSANVELGSAINWSYNPSSVGSTQYDAVGALEHEISEVMGRELGSNVTNGFSPTPLALFRYNQGVIDTTSNISRGGDDDYFSNNGGVTVMRADMGESGGDLADWGGPATDDAFGYAGKGKVTGVTAIDMTVMETIGWSAATDDFWSSGTAAWSTPGDWTDGVPTADSDVTIITGEPEITTPVSVNYMTILPTATLQIGAALTIGAAGLTMDPDAGLVIAAGGLNLGFGIDLTGGTAGLDDEVNSVTLSEIVSGLGALSISGDLGALTLSGANTYSGGTSVNSGTTLKIAAGANIGSGALTLDAGATLDLTAATSLNNAISLAGVASLEVTNYWDYLNGQITGLGGLSVSGGGGLILTDNSNSYSGGTTVNGGVLDLTAGGALGSGTLVLEGGAGVDLWAVTVGNAINVVGAGSLYVVSGDSAKLTGKISNGPGTGSLTIDGPGNLTLAGANAYTGGTTVDGGSKLSISAANNIGTTGALTLDGGSTLDLTAAFTLGTAIVLNGAASLGVTKDWDYLTGKITGSGSLAVSGGGDVELSNTSNSFAGGTTVTGGVFYVGAAGALGGGGLVLTGGAVVDFNTEKVKNAITIAGAIQFVTFVGDSTALSGKISDGASEGSLVTSGAGTLTLSDDNTYSGGTTVDSGSTLSISADDNIGGGTLTLDGGTLDLTRDNATYSVPVDIEATSSVVVNFDYTLPDYFSGVVSGAGGLMLSGSGELALNDDSNDYTGGTTVNASRLAAYADDALGTGTLTLENGAFVDLGYSTIGNNISVANTDTLFVYQGNVATLNGNISDGATTGGLIVTGGGELVLAGSNTNSGGTEVQSNTTLSISAADNIGSGTLTLDGGSTLSFGGTLSLSDKVLISGAVTIQNTQYFSFLDGTVVDGPGGSGSLTISGGGGTLSAGRQHLLRRHDRAGRRAWDFRRQCAGLRRADARRQCGFRRPSQRHGRQRHIHRRQFQFHSARRRRHIFGGDRRRRGGGRDYHWKRWTRRHDRTVRRQHL